MNKQPEVSAETGDDVACAVIGAKLRQYGEGRHRYLRAEALFRAGAVIIPLASALIVLDLWTGLPEWVRWIDAVGLLAAAILILAIHWWLPVARWSDEKAARELERGFPELGQRLRTIRELEQTLPHTTSRSAFAHALMAEIRDRLNRIEPGRLLLWNRLRPIGFTAGAVLSSVVIAVAIWPDFRIGALRFVMPGSGFSFTNVAVERTSDKFTERENPSIAANVSGRAVRAASLYTREPGGEWVETKMAPAGSDRYDAVLTGRKNDFEYYVAAGDGRSKVFRMRHLPTPKVELAWSELQFPEYTGLGSQRIDGGDVTAVEGVSVRVVFQLNHPLTNASAITSEGRGLPIVIAGNQISFTEVLNRGEITYQLFGTDDEGLDLSPTSYKLVGLEDKPPEVKLVEPAKDLEATSVWEIISRLQAKDDFGLAEIGIVLAVGEEMKLIAQRKIEDRDVRETGEMASAMLEEFPLTINDNIKLYAFARDHKPRDGARSVSNLRAIDIRQFKTRWRVVNGMAGGAGMPPVSGPQLMKLGEMIKQQRQIVSDAFILKENGAASDEELAKVCDGLHDREGKLTIEARRLKAVIEEEGGMRPDDLVLLDTAAQQMDESAKHFNGRLARPAYRQADRALSSLLELRKLIMKLISQNGAPCPCAEEKADVKTLTELAKEAERLAAEERAVRGQVAPEPKPGGNIEATRRQQQVAVTDAGELFSALVAHPEATELALQRIEKAEQEMTEAEKVVLGNRPQDGESRLQAAEDLLSELADHLRALDKKNLAATMAKFAEQAAKAQGQLENAAKESKGDRNSQGKSPSSLSNQAKRENTGDKQKTSESGAGETKAAKNEAEDTEIAKKSLAKIAERAETIDDVLKNLAHPKDSSPGDERIVRLREQTGSDSLGKGVREVLKEQKEGKVTDKRAVELAGRFNKLSEGLGREHRRLLQSRIEQLAAAQAKTRDLIKGNGKQGAESSGGSRNDPKKEQEGIEGGAPKNRTEGQAAKAENGPNSKRGTSNGSDIATGGGGSDLDLKKSYLEDIERLQDDVLIRLIQPLAEELKTGNLDVAKLMPIDERLQKLLNDLLRVNVSGAGGEQVPQEYERLVEQYFRALSDDFGDEEWHANENENQK